MVSGDLDRKAHKAIFASFVIRAAKLRVPLKSASIQKSQRELELECKRATSRQASKTDVANNYKPTAVTNDMPTNCSVRVLASHL